MGFPSPATDYEEDRLTLNKIFEVDLNCRLVETDCGWAVVNTSLKPEPDGVVLAIYDGRNHFVRLMGGALITEDGEAIEDDALDDVVVHGVLTHTINRLKEDDGVVCSYLCNHFRSLILHIPHCARDGVPDKPVSGHDAISDYLFSFFPANILPHPFKRLLVTALMAAGHEYRLGLYQLQMSLLENLRLRPRVRMACCRSLP